MKKIRISRAFTLMESGPWLQPSLGALGPRSVVALKRIDD
jgi:hypothetical protein